MKKLLFITFIVFLQGKTHAQVFQKTLPNSKQNVTLKNIPPAPAPPTNNPPTAANTQYYLSAASVTIVTGNDNKEQPSRVRISLNRISGGEWPSDDNTKPCGLYDYNFSTNINTEYKINSVTEIPLVSPFKLPASIPGGIAEGWRYINLLLSNIHLHGLHLYIMYDPNFILDAWKINSVSLTLAFKDINGNPHPTLGTITIPFLKSAALLNDGNRTLKLETDKYLMPKI